MDKPEGWITRLESDSTKHLNIEINEGKEPTLTYFSNKKIYLPSEKEAYEKEVLQKGPKTIWLGVTGWTKPPKHYTERYGMNNENGLYEKLVTTLLLENILELKLNDINVDLRHGASNAGVDAAIMKVMETIKVSGSGVNCPMYMTWVADDTRGGPVYVAENKNAYHDAYSDFTQILIVTGGRDVAFYHDYLRRLKGTGFSVVADVIQTATDNIVPGTEVMTGSDKAVLNNAAAYIREKNSFQYNSIPRNFEELSAITRAAVLNNSYNI
jgi:hypothetical protein